LLACIVGTAVAESYQSELSSSLALAD